MKEPGPYIPIPSLRERSYLDFENLAPDRAPQPIMSLKDLSIDYNRYSDYLMSLADKRPRKPIFEP